MNLIILIVSAVIIFVYAVLIINFINGWSSLPEYQYSKKDIDFQIAIITACKNEIAHLPSLFQAVNEQTYRHFQLILVDDGSTDGSWEYANEVQKGFPELKLLKNMGVGKKEAIKTAIEQADVRLVITLDADCLPQPAWLETIVHFYDEKFTDLVICPMKMSSNGSFLQDFQQFDFTALIASGAGAAEMDMPILCNGANLAFRKFAWLKSIKMIHFEELSGDDIYLLQSIKRQHGTIRFLKSTNAAVETSPKKTWRELINQRKRWAGKRAAYSDMPLTLTALIVFLASFTLLLNIIFAVIYPKWFFFVFLLFSLKWLVDFSFFYIVKDFFSLKKVRSRSFLFSLIYPFYIVFTAFISFFQKNKKW